jgi:hypothetical protein
MPLYRILIKTHHMTSRKKILAITKATKRLSCSVILKTGSRPGIMLAEGESALEWMEIVRVRCAIALFICFVCFEEGTLD